MTMADARITLDDGRTVTVSHDGCIRVLDNGRKVVEVNVSDLEHGNGNQGTQYGHGNVQTNVYR